MPETFLSCESNALDLDERTKIWCSCWCSCLWRRNPPRASFIDWAAIVAAIRAIERRSRNVIGSRTASHQQRAGSGQSAS